MSRRKRSILSGMLLMATLGLLLFIGSPKAQDQEAESAQGPHPEAFLRSVVANTGNIANVVNHAVTLTSTSSTTTRTVTTTTTPTQTTTPAKTSSSTAPDVTTTGKTTGGKTTTAGGGGGS